MEPICASEMVRVGPQAWPGVLVVPARAAALVLFVHGCPPRGLRSDQVARVFHRHRLATLMPEPPASDRTEAARSGDAVALLAAQVGVALQWIAARADLARLPIGLFGAGTGAAAALAAAARHAGAVHAVVSRGGRPDLAAGDFDHLEAPTLLIVGSADPQVVARYRNALRALHCNKRLEVVPGAGSRFAEPGALDAMAELAAGWFEHHLAHTRLV